tara:strand:- start:2858 stop:3928 length:1071 start_codon:yes stop_codon:yes gene_type:complete
MDLAGYIDDNPPPAEPRRDYLGVSSLGHECFSWVFLTWRWCLLNSSSPKTMRILNDGTHIEERTLERLAMLPHVKLEGSQIGGEQFGGHVKWHVDNIISGLPDTNGRFVLEIKSANQARFRECERKGLQGWDVAYFAQVQYYIGALRELGNDDIESAILLVYNKNTSEFYSETIDFIPAVYESYKERAENLVYLNPVETDELTRAYTRSFYKAKNYMHADDYGVYFNDFTPREPNCRNCVFAKPRPDLDGNRWHCSLKKKHLDYQAQLAGCTSHLFIPLLVPGKVIDMQHDAITYKNNNGDTFVNSAIEGDRHYTSGELAFLTRHEFDFDKTDSTVKSLRSEFGPTRIHIETVSDD